MFGFAKEEYDASKHLNIQQQERIAGEVRRLAEKEPLSKSILLLYPGYVSYIPCLAFSMVSWRACFRGYNLVRYGRGRIMTVVMAMLYPIYGSCYHHFISEPSLLNPFRAENPWYYGLKFALVQKISNLGMMFGSIGITYVVATTFGMIHLPGKGLHKPTGKERVNDMILKGLRPYAKGMLKASLASSAFMFVVGAGGYYQSKRILATMNRRTLCLNEDLS